MKGFVKKRILPTTPFHEPMELGSLDINAAMNLSNLLNCRTTYTDVIQNLRDKNKELLQENENLKKELATLMEENPKHPITILNSEIILLQQKSNKKININGNTKGVLKSKLLSPTSDSQKEFFRCYRCNRS